MSGDPFSVDAMARAWVQMQGQMASAQRAFWDAAAPGAAGEGAAAADPWAAARQVSEQWLQTVLPSAASGDDGIVRATLRRMLDPGELMGAGGDDVSRTIQALVSGGTGGAAEVGRDVLQATAEWLALQAANGDYRLIVAQAWGRAFARFLQASGGETAAQGAADPAALKRWLEIADAEMIATQRSEAFLAAQRKLLRAASDYRLRERALHEAWCEARSIPTRSEIDELQATVQELKRELRRVRRAMAASGRSADTGEGTGEGMGG